MEKYKKLKVVGKGSFGYALLVQAIQNKKYYIIKIIDISKMDRKQREEALNEVHVLKAMRHPYIITYRESFMEKKCLCIVMDYADGGDLYAKIARQKELGQLFTEEQILDWFVQMALAMNHIHERKILHRDLKTQNIFLTAKNDVKIGDFGIARVLQHTYDCAKTAIGTPYYLSPEICQEKPYNQKSDIWSLGCILYELTTLNHAFDAMSMKELVLKILRGTYPPIPAQYSPELQGLLADMLIKDPSKRPSIKRILEKDFLKARISNLLVSTLNRHELSDINEIKPIQESNKQLDQRILQNLSQNSSPNTQRILHQQQLQQAQIDKQQLQQQQLREQQQSQQSLHQQQHSQSSLQQQIQQQQQQQQQQQVQIQQQLSSVQQQFQQQQLKYQNKSPIRLKQVQMKSSSPLQYQTIEQSQPSQPHLVNRQFSSISQKENVKESGKLTNIEFLQKLSQKDKSKSPIVRDMKRGQLIQEESFESEGYGYLLKDIKKCLDKKVKPEEEEIIIQDNIVPQYFILYNRFLNQNIKVPGTSDRDTVGYKIEALRYYLEEQIGFDAFMQAYQTIESCQESESIKLVNQILNQSQRKFIPLIFQLIVCEDSYY